MGACEKVTPISFFKIRACECRYSERPEGNSVLPGPGGTDSYALYNVGGGN